MNIDYIELFNFTKKIFRKVGLDKQSVEAVSIGLCEASLRGVDSHGIRLLPDYVTFALSGRKNPLPKFNFTQKFPAFGVLDADNAFGHAAGMKAIDYCIDMAKLNGIGSVSVINSSHPGALASMALVAARQGYIAMVFTHADSLMLSHNGKRPFFGTNPICFAAPRKEKDPYCLDMATSIISWNKLLSKRSKNERLDKDVAADFDGNITSNPEKATCLLPAGSYKGYGLASMVEVLCGVMTGMNVGPEIPPMYDYPNNKTRKLGQFYMVMRSDACLNKNEFIDRMQKFTDDVRLEPANVGEKVLLPNDPEIETSRLRMVRGIPVNEKILQSLNDLSVKFDVPLRVKV